MLDFFPVLASHPLSTALLILSTTIIAYISYILVLHPLSHIPGPISCRISSLWLYYHSYLGGDALQIRHLHKRYGPIVRIAPSHVSVSDGDAVHPIYVANGGFLKAACYANFDTDGHATIFTTLDSAHRALRARAVAPMFTTASIRAHAKELYACTDRMIAQFQEQRLKGGRVDVMRLTRGLAVNFISTHFFDRGGGDLLKEDVTTLGLDVDDFVNCWAPVGRFFFVPTWLHPWLEWASDKLAPNLQAYAAAGVVDSFVEDVVNRSSKEEGDHTSYVGRLRDAGLSRPDIVALCKELIYSGTESSAMNLAYVCRHLAMNPAYLTRVAEELETTEVSESTLDFQYLPFLCAVIKETLRLSTANTTSLPRVVPSSGWTFKSTFFPQGTTVGCSSFELQMNSDVFPSPETFRPGRWLTDDEAVRERINKHWLAFGAGSRVCMARSLAMMQLYMATERLVKSQVLVGANVCHDRRDEFKWYNSSVKQEKIELMWSETS